MSATSHPSFEKVSSTPVTALQLTIEEYRHIATGAIHYHLASDNDENVFLVALRTVPMDHKGVAHILEHTALCGSERFPVRDPFFMMIRRSLNTFMNAFTSNDWTAYPFASQNRKDFFNLLDVYLDAVFFSRLDELDFLQEGHRIEFEEAENPDANLVYKGVVYNEMKGAMSSISSVLWQSLCKHLFKHTTYHYNSGGDPEHITDLSYQELTDFYKEHYHPSNAIFMTYGNIPAHEHHAFWEEKALSGFDKGNTSIDIGLEPRLKAPVQAFEQYAFDSNESEEKQTHLVMGWLLGKSTDLNDLLQAQLLSYALLEHSACPLQHFLETTSLGSTPSPLCGLEDSYHELIFCCGITGSEKEHLASFEEQVMEILESVAQNGVPYKRLKAIVHQIELSHREVSGDGYPYGLQLILTGLTSATHRANPVDLLDLEPALASLHQAIEDPEFIKQLAKELLVNNTHRVSLVLSPDKALSKQNQDKEKAKLAAIKAQLTDEQKQAIIKQTKALEARQNQIDDISILPKVGIEDVADDIHIAEGTIKNSNGIENHCYAQGTNGLVYQQAFLPIPAMEEELLQLLPLYTQLLSEVGFNELTFSQVQELQSEVVGSIYGFSSLRGSVESEQKVIGYIAVSAKALNAEQKGMSELVYNTLRCARFDEIERIKDIVSQNYVRKINSIPGNGHSLAMCAASENLSPLAKLNENWGGMKGIQALKALNDNCQKHDFAEDLSNKLQALHQLFLQAPVMLINVAEQDMVERSTELLNEIWPANTPDYKELDLPATRSHQQVAWMSNSQINFCAKVFAAVPAGHPDAPALTVLGGFLRNGYLHSAIREKGGAYGSGATLDTNTASFRFYSYRDPRVSGTLEDFDKSIHWMLINAHTDNQLEEAILGVVSSLDKPASPAGEAKHAFINQLFGRTPEQRRTFRQNVLQVTLDDLKRVTKTYLDVEEASIGIISHEAMQDELNTLGLEVRAL